MSFGFAIWMFILLDTDCHNRYIQTKWSDMSAESFPVPYITGGRMKRILGTLMFVMVLAFGVDPAYGQIPNPGFETWGGTPGFEAPTGWTVNNIPGFATSVTRTTPGHGGTYAIKGDVVNVTGLGLYPPYVWTVFSYAQRPGSLTGYYKYTTASADSLEIFVVLYQGSFAVPIASNEWTSLAATAAFTKFSLPLTYYSAETPDTAWIEFIIAPGDDDTLHLGSSFVLDDLAFEGTATGVADDQAKPTSFALEQNYPNPFNPETSIRYDLPEAATVRLSVYNTLGEEIALLVDEQEPAGSYQVKFNASALSSGMYFYRMQATSPGGERGFIQTRRLMLVK
jgi:hypothetical protein